MKECPQCSLCYEDAVKYCNEDGQELIASLAGPRELGRWRLDRVVGVGRQGAVYSATDLSEQRRVIVKTLLPSLFLEPGTLATFLSDMDRIVKFSHPNAGAILAVGRLANGGAFVACEYISGRSLKRALAEDNLFTIDRAVEVACQLGEGLGAAHEAGILHRDVKPDNIILDFDQGLERAKLVDFGLARWTSGRGGSSMTTTGSLVIRMPHYSSPEQCKGEDVDARSDVYSLGIVLYEMLTGKVPFDAPSPMTVIVKHVTDQPEPPTRTRPEISGMLESVLMSSLSKVPSERPSDGRSFARELRRAMGSRVDTPVPVAPNLPRATEPSGPLPPVAPAENRTVPPLAAPLPMRLTIVDSGDEENTSRRIDGRVRDASQEGLRIETGTIETGRLNVIRDHTTAFKNRLELEIDLPSGTVRLSGFAVWYRPAPDGINWNVGVYIRDMPSADRSRYNDFLKSVSAQRA